MKNLKQSIGIVGGMGPQASAKLLEVIVSMCTKDFGAKNDSDFPEIILNSVPVPDFITNKKNINTVLNILKKRIKNLEAFNPLCFGIACNTAHLVLKNLQTNTDIPFVSIIDSVIKKVLDARITKVGLLGTPVTIKCKLYQKPLTENNIDIVLPSKREQLIIESIIRNILAGKNNSTDRQKLILAAKSLKQRGAQGIILGCTELPLIFPKNFPLAIFDSINILAEALLQKFFKNKAGKN